MLRSRSVASLSIGRLGWRRALAVTRKAELPRMSVRSAFFLIAVVSLATWAVLIEMGRYFFE